MPIASSLLNKPRLLEKLRKFYDYVQKNDGKVGQKTRGIDLNFNNACNLRCKYCFTNSPKGDHVKEYLDIKAIKRLANKNSKVSCHYFIKRDGTIINMVPDKFVAWHAGLSCWKSHKNLNNRSIGIEIQNSGHTNKFEKFSLKQIKSVVSLSKILKKKI